MPASALRDEEGDFRLKRPEVGDLGVLPVMRDLRLVGEGLLRSDLSNEVGEVMPMVRRRVEEGERDLVLVDDKSATALRSMLK